MSSKDGNLITARRMEVGIGSNELARAIGISSGDMSKYATGRVEPGVRRANLIAAALESTTEILWPIDPTDVLDRLEND